MNICLNCKHKKEHHNEYGQCCLLVDETRTGIHTADMPQCRCRQYKEDNKK